MPESLRIKASQASSPQAQGWYDNWKQARTKGVVWDTTGYGGVPKNIASQADQQRLAELTREGIAKGYMPTPKKSGGLMGVMDKVVEYGVPLVVGAGITAGTAGAMGFGPLAGGTSTGSAFGGMGTGSMSTAGGGVASTGSGVATGIGSGGGFGGGAGAFGGYSGVGSASASAASGGASAGGTLATLGKYSGLIGGGLSALGTAYAANKGAKAAENANSTANRAIDLALMPRSTQYGSYVNPNAGVSFLDPSIRSLRERALGRMPQYRAQIDSASSELNSNLAQTRNDLASNENPFIQARVNPLLARAAEGRGALTRSMTSRGLGGSSLFSNSLGNYDAITGREIGDQRSLATSESLNAITGLDTQRYNAAVSHIQALQGMDQHEQSVAAQNLAQELAALGFSQADTGAILQAAGVSIKAGALENDVYGKAFESLGRTLGSFRSNSGAVA